MRIEHGTYTVAEEYTSGETWSPASKVYTNDLNDVDVTFTLNDGSTVTMHVYRGTVLPIVTKSASWAGSGTLVVLR